jgi:hypothetical protein
MAVPDACDGEVAAAPAAAHPELGEDTDAAIRGGERPMTDLIPGDAHNAGASPQPHLAWPGRAAGARCGSQPSPGIADPRSHRPGPGASVGLPGGAEEGVERVEDLAATGEHYRLVANYTYDRESWFGPDL